MRSILLATLFLGLTACAQDGSDDPAAAPEAETRAAPVAVAAPPPPTIVDPPEETVTGSGLKIITHARGNGAEATNGALVAVHYTGWLTDEDAPGGRGNKFDSSVERGEPIEFPLGAGRVIPGWDHGLLGMRAGGRRTLIIPSELAYGPRGRPPIIPGGASLTFDVELVDVDGGQ